MAAPKPITGKLSRPGYTVIALAADGRAAAVRAGRGAFTLRPRAGSVTLHLRGRDGVYAGPIVVGGRGTRAIVGVRAGARLGRVSVRRGYARVSRRLSERSLDARRTARARRGIPIGARAFGRVRSRPPRDPVRGDRDVDGVPDPLDVDDDGDLILDTLERSTAPRAAQAANTFFQVTNMNLGLEQTANANAFPPGTPPEAQQAHIDGTLSRFGDIGIHLLPGDVRELDCGGANQVPPRPQGLAYCSAGGTGRFSSCCPLVSRPFPGDPGGEFDPDGDGFGRLVPLSPGAMVVPYSHGARSDQIGTGDVLLQWVATGVPESQCPPPSGPLPSGCAPYSSTLQFVFATVPALVSYRDGAGNSATVSYPVASGTEGPPPSPGGPGTLGNGLPVAPCPPGAPPPCVEGDVVVTLTFWRPQRRPIPPETAEWIDIGGLTYSTALQFFGPGSGSVRGGPCPDGAYSTTPDQPLALASGAGLTDTRDPPDQPTSATTMLTYTVNLSRCIQGSWGSGQEAAITLAARAARGEADFAEQQFFFKRQ